MRLRVSETLPIKPPGNGGSADQQTPPSVYHLFLLFIMGFVWINSLSSFINGPGIWALCFLSAQISYGRVVRDVHVSAWN